MPAPVAAAATATVLPPAAPVAAAVAKPSVSGKVGILIGGELATEALTAAVSKALVVEGITGSVISYASDASIVPFAAKKLCGLCDVVIVASIIMDPTNTVAASLRNSLSQIALSTDVPVIPALVVQDSLLEAKALLATLSASWAKAAATVLCMKSGDIQVAAAPEPVIAAPLVHTPAIDDAGTLMNVFRESLNAHGARGIAGISRKFRIADDDNSGRIEYKEFVKVIAEHALGWTDKQVRIVFDSFDSDKSGAIERI